MDNNYNTTKDLSGEEALTGAARREAQLEELEDEQYIEDLKEELREEILQEIKDEQEERK